MSSVLLSVQQEIACRLWADPFFATIPVLIEVPRDMGFELQASVAAVGTYGVVQVPHATVSSPTAPGPIFDPVEFAIRFRENIPVSAGPHALEVAETALALLHLYRPPTFNEVICAAPQALQRVIEPNVVTYEVRVRTQAGAGYAVPQLNAPVLTSAGTQSPQVVTLSCDVPGAAIFYTTDGSQPAPRSPTAKLSTVPFTMSGPGVVRAQAWLAGWLTSAEVRGCFS